jgi:hypothetical protein
MSIAQAEAVLAAAVSFQPAPADDELAAALLSAIEHGPAALASSAPIQQALKGLVQRLPVAVEVRLQALALPLAKQCNQLTCSGCAFTLAAGL